MGIIIEPVKAKTNLRVIFMRMRIVFVQLVFAFTGSILC